MTDMIKADEVVSKTDQGGRVLMPALQRERLLEEFERSGISGPLIDRRAGSGMFGSAGMAAWQAGEHHRAQWSEFCSRVLDTWVYENGVRLEFIRPGRRMENGFIESFNGKLRDECLNTEIFFTLEDARQKLEQ